MKTNVVHTLEFDQPTNLGFSPYYPSFKTPSITTIKNFREDEPPRAINRHQPTPIPA